MPEINNPLDIIKRLDVKQNVTIRVIDEATGKVVQEHIGHNAATNSLLTGIAHYLMGDGVLNQGGDTLSMWVPQYISLGTMGLTSQDSETIVIDGDTYIVPSGIGYTPAAPESATPEEKELNAQLRFTEYINQAPGFGADGYDENTNNDREWFGLGYPYTLKPDKLSQDFFDAGENYYELSTTPTDLSSGIISVTVYPQGVINEDQHDSSVTRMLLSTSDYEVYDNLTQEFTGDGTTVAYELQHQAKRVVSVSVNSAEVEFTYDVATNVVTLATAPEVDDQIEVFYYTASPILHLYNGSTYVGRIAIIYTVSSTDAANCELIQAKLDNGTIVPLTLRSKITYRDLVPEISSEVPNTLDVIFSAFVSTGALKEYRGDNNYIYITEAGLWSKPNFSDSGDNGLLAGYRIMPSDDEIPEIRVTKDFTGDGEQVTFVLDDSQGNSIDEVLSVTIDGVGVISYTLDKNAKTITFTTAPDNGSAIEVLFTAVDVTHTWKDMTVEANRQKVQQSIIRVGVNQIAQIIWKLQLGGLEQLNGLRYLYPSQYPEEVWTIV